MADARQGAQRRPGEGPPTPRVQSLGEEIANSVTHGAGLLASLVGLPLLVVAAARRGDGLLVVGAVVFAVSLVALYAASTAYHAWRPSRAKRVLRLVDHAAIYLLIAGTCTPFALGVLRGGSGWALLGTVWSLAALGILLKLRLGFRHPRASTLSYLAMGWLALPWIGPMAERMPASGLAWIAAGGLLYTGGVAFYVWERARYGHAVWHLFVVAGSACHFLAVLWYGLPAAV